MEKPCSFVFFIYCKKTLILHNTKTNESASSKGTVLHAYEEKTKKRKVQILLVYLSSDLVSKLRLPLIST